MDKKTKFDIIKTFDENHIKVLESSIKLNTPALIVGHTGLGKTTLLAELAKRHGKKLTRLSVHSGVTGDEILGKWLAESGSTVWQDGLLIQAMKNGDWIVFDEINACPADVLFALHSLLDDDRHVTLLEKKGEIIKPHADFRFFATMNPPDDYAGTKEMNMAFTSRFNAIIEVKPYKTSIEVSILESKGVSSSNAKKLVEIANAIRVYKEKDDIVYFCGTRDIINTGLMIENGLNIELALQYGIVNKMCKDDREFVGAKVSLLKYEDEKSLLIQKLEQQAKDLKAEMQLLKQKESDMANLPAEVKKALTTLGVKI